MLSKTESSELEKRIKDLETLIKKDFIDEGGKKNIDRILELLKKHLSEKTTV
ncbi:MAG: hypothetical protein K1X86_12000 [Ignavibacteria bacterium]|nr:hypothetical protein [Ignavibacteria bacterium]